MAIELKEQVPVRAGEPVALPVRGVTAREAATWLLVSILVGVAVGLVAHSLVTAEDRTARVVGIQQSRAEAVVRAYERAWMAAQPTAARIRVTGTGPGLAWVADRQAVWAEHAITGTGPGLATVARMQAGYEPGADPTGTGPGLEHLSRTAGPEEAVIGTP